MMPHKSFQENAMQPNALSGVFWFVATVKPVAIR